jgi:AAA+ ATPase superfamily predicted ATPase
VYALFVTDGNNGDQTQAERIIRESAALPIFWQFVGVGREQFEFLRKLDDLKGRVVDNADFYPVADLDRVSDEELYENILGELPTWLSEVKAKGMI